MEKRGGLYLLAALALAAALHGPARAQAAGGVVYGVLVDNSASLESQRPRVLAFGEAVVRRVSRRGPVSLYGYAAKAGPEEDAVIASHVGWSQDEGLLRGRVRELSFVRGAAPSVIEAVRVMAGELDAKAAGGATVEKVIVLITDGHYRVRWPKEKLLVRSGEESYERKRVEGELVKALKASGVKVYAVGLTEALGERVPSMLRSENRSSRDYAEEFLKRVTKETGGRVLFPPSKEFDAEAFLDKLFAP